MNDVKHVANFVVNEDGAEAAATTGTIISRLGGREGVKKVKMLTLRRPIQKTFFQQYFSFILEIYL